jgi:hypothetical protein
MTGVLEAVKKGFSVASKSLGLVGILILFNLVGNLVSIPFAVTPGTQVAPQATAGVLAFSLIFVLVSIFFQGATLGLVRDYIKAGSMKLSDLAGYGSKYYLRLLGLGLLIISAIAVIALIAGLLVAITSPINNIAVTVVAVTIAIAIAVISAVMYFIPFTLAPYALVCDDIGVMASMKKSLDVVKPLTRVGVLILLYVILILISLGIGFAVGFLVGLITAVLPASIGKILMAITTSVINGYLGIVMSAAFMVFYLGLGREKTA